MKTKDIKVGETYAIGAPNASYDTYRRIQGTITRTGVHGQVSGTWHSHTSEHANYVEFTVGEEGSGSTYKYRMAIDENTGKPDKASFYKSDAEKKRKPKIVNVNRCMASHVLMTWDEYLMRKAEHEKAERQAEARKKAKIALAEQLKSRFARVGFEPHIQSYGVFKVEFHQGDAERLADALEALALHRGEV